MVGTEVFGVRMQVNAGTQCGTHVAGLQELVEGPTNRDRR